LETGFFKWRPHPWHGLSPGPQPPDLIQVFVELTPFDQVKYELDKQTGFLKVDRPLYASSRPPSVYGFIPQTLSGPRVGKLMPQAAGGDDDPLDVCVIASQPLTKSEVLLNARIVGCLPMLDDGLADHKLLAVLANDGIWGSARDLSDLPKNLLEHHTHYFETYKLRKDTQKRVQVGAWMHAEEAKAVIIAGMLDYQDRFGEPT